MENEILCFGLFDLQLIIKWKKWPRVKTHEKKIKGSSLSLNF